MFPENPFKSSNKVQDSKVKTNILGANKGYV